jgi:hypothetical protein
MHFIGTKKATIEKNPLPLNVPLGIVHNLAEYNGAGLRTTKEVFQKLTRIVLAWLRLPAKVQKATPPPTKLAIKKSQEVIICDWCFHNDRNPFLDCAVCGIGLCAHAARRKDGVIGSLCAKHAK